MHSLFTFLHLIVRYKFIFGFLELGSIRAIEGINSENTEER